MYLLYFLEQRPEPLFPSRRFYPGFQTTPALIARPPFNYDYYYYNCLNWLHLISSHGRQPRQTICFERAQPLRESVVRGHHIYQKSWTPMIRGVLIVEREENNQHDDYAVAVTKNGDIIGHVPCSISRISQFFFSEMWRSYNMSDCASHVVNDPALIRDPAFISEIRTLTTSL